jgi:hypothetical protein
MRKTVLTVALAAAVLAGCDRKEFYRQQGNPPGQNPKGTPSDRTGGSKPGPDGAGGGPQNPYPADQPAPKK